MIKKNTVMRQYYVARQVVGLLTLMSLLGSILALAPGYSKAEEAGLKPIMHSEYASPEQETRLSPVPAYSELPVYSDELETWGCQSYPDCGTSGCSTGGFFGNGSRFRFSGWVESGLYTNAHGATSLYSPTGDGLLRNSGNGPNFGPGLRTTDYNMNQLWGRFAREMDSTRGLDWGLRADLVYGMNGYGVQCEDAFDNGWGRGDYGFGFHQLYGEIGYKNLTARYGKFGTPIGWEETASWDNFFYTHSYCFNIEPCTHTGAMVYYRVTDGLKLAGGWTAGMENSFSNRYGDQSLIAGLELEVTKNSTLYYYMTQGRMNDSFGGGYVTDFFNQSVCFEWNPTDRWTYVLQYNLNNLNEFGGGRLSAYGINNHLIYHFCDKWGLGLRAEWLRDNGVLAYEDAQGNNNDSDYLELTLGLNFNPSEHVRIRPEIRYDHAFKNAIFAHGTKNEQFSGGFAVLVGF